LTAEGAEVGGLFEQACRGERRALGRLLSLVERSADDADLVDEILGTRRPTPYVVGVTGAPGAGKSTLVGRLVAAAADGGARIAVLAVDPSSPRHGGAILGDRIRMDGVVGGEVFIRSMASRGHHGGLALAVPGAIRVLGAVGFDLVFVETVGVGQVEVEIAAAADTTVVLVTPGWGDAIQANKSGLLEVADLFVVNKSDAGDADAACRDLEHMLDLGALHDGDGGASRRPEIRRTAASRDEGISEVWAAIERHRDAVTADGSLEHRRSARYRDEVRMRLAVLVARRIDDELATAAVADDARDRLTVGAAARQIATRVLTTPRTGAPADPRRAR
jgi:LAO/AO transport system kinase